MIIVSGAVNCDCCSPHSRRRKLIELRATRHGAPSPPPRAPPRSGTAARGETAAQKPRTTTNHHKGQKGSAHNRNPHNPLALKNKTTKNNTKPLQGQATLRCTSSRLLSSVRPPPPHPHPCPPPILRSGCPNSRYCGGRESLFLGGGGSFVLLFDFRKRVLEIWGIYISGLRVHSFISRSFLVRFPPCGSPGRGLSPKPKNSNR